jgi:hypothetical protein
MSETAKDLWKEYNDTMEALGGSDGQGRQIQDKGALHREAWTAQVKVCLPLIELERNAFITAQYGRLEPVIGTEYWDEKTEEYRTLGYDGNKQILDDPYELDLITLHKLAFLRKRLVMLNTYSYAAFFHMFPEDRDRLGFLSGLWSRITGFGQCSPEELDRLFTGHESFMERNKR